MECIDLLVNNAGINTNMGWRKCMEVREFNLLNVSQFKAIGMRRLSEKQNKKKFIKLLSLPFSQSRFPGEHNWCYDWNRNCSGEDEKGEG